MASTPIAYPARFAPGVAIAFSSDGNAIAIDHDNPLPVGERAYQGAMPIVPDTDQPPRRGVAILCTSPGSVSLKLADDSQIALPVQAGLTILPFAVKTVNVAGTTAVATFHNLV